MTIDIYPAFMKGREIDHADNWDDESTLNITHGNFWPMVHTLGLDSVITSIPGSIQIKTLVMALKVSPETRYTERLKKIVAIAQIKRANIIAFA